MRNKNIFITLMSLTSLTFGYIHVDKIDFTMNPYVGNMSVEYVNEKDRNCRLNYTFNFIKDIQSGFAYIAVNIPNDATDDKYQKQVLKTTFDLTKALNGVRSNFITSALMENAQQSVDFELKLPIKKGVYRMVNFTATDQFFPPFMNIPKILFNLRYVGKVEGRKTSQLVVNYYFYLIRKH